MTAEADRFVVGDVECLRLAGVSTSLDLKRVPARLERQLDRLLPCDRATAAAVDHDLERSGVSERTFIETARRAQIVASAIDTIAEVGYARASLGRIAERIGISRGLISYHFADKDELMSEVVREVLEQGRRYMTHRILAHSTGPEMLRAYIESNLAFIREHPNAVLAVVEIARNGVTAYGQPRLYSYDIDEAVRALAHLLSGFQDAGQLRADFDPRAMATAIRGTIDAVPGRLRFDPQFDIDNYAREMTKVYELATRVDR